SFLVPKRNWLIPPTNRTFCSFFVLKKGKVTFLNFKPSVFRGVFFFFKFIFWAIPLLRFSPQLGPGYSLQSFFAITVLQRNYICPGKKRISTAIPIAMCGLEIVFKFTK